jgi:hypothetical protein
VDLDLLLVAPDIPQLERASGRGSDLRLFAIHAVSDDLFERNKTGHLPVLCHLDGPFPAPDCPRRRLLSPGFFFMAKFADTALLIQQPPHKYFQRYYSITYGQAGDKNGSAPFIR